MNDKINLCLAETYKHVKKVQKNLNLFIHDLISRGENHDNSKFEEPELSIFAENTEKLGKTVYGSEEYKQLLVEVKPAIDHHYSKNRHHPEWSLTNLEETWRDIVGYEGYYKISSRGNIKRNSRTVIRENQGNFFVKEKDLLPTETPKGYLRIQLSKETKKQNHLIHRLVAEAFISNPENKPLVNHKNSNRKDNCLENLEWATESENLKHAYDEGQRISNAKYVVICEELDLLTIGTPKMEESLKAKGYANASSASIFNCINGSSETHLGFNFISYPIAEFYEPNKLEHMNLVDLIELLADWKAASERNKNGCIYNSIEINSYRYNICPQVRKILENTVREYFKE